MGNYTIKIMIAETIWEVASRWIQLETSILPGFGVAPVYLRYITEILRGF